MVWRKVYRRSQIVAEADYDSFTRRCKAQLAMDGVREATVPMNRFHGDHFHTDKQAFKHKMRALIKFFMKHPFYDDSLVVFYPLTPKGRYVVEARAIKHFFLYMYTPLGQQVFDLHVSTLCFSIYNSAPFSLPNFPGGTCCQLQLCWFANHIASGTAPK